LERRLRKKAEEELFFLKGKKCPVEVQLHERGGFARAFEFSRIEGSDKRRISAIGGDQTQNKWGKIGRWRESSLHEGEWEKVRTTIFET